MTTLTNLSEMWIFHINFLKKAKLKQIPKLRKKSLDIHLRQKINGRRKVC